MSGRRSALSWRSSALVLLGYLAVSVALFGPDVLGHLDSDCLCSASADPMQYVWSMVWVPHAIGSGLNPFLTSAMWAPGPFDLAATGWAPLASLVAIPVTLTLGPLAAYNLLVLLSPALAAFFTFRLCHYLTGRVAPSVVGGFLFGFSSYLVSQMGGHLHLMLVFFIPLGVHLVLLHLDGRTTRRRFVVSFAAVVVGQALLSTEILFTGLLFGAIALAAGFVLADADGRDRIRRVVSGILIGGVAAAVVLAPFLYYALIYDSTPPALAVARFSMDALNPFVPTLVDRVGGLNFVSLTETFPGAFVETGGYLGIATVLLAGWWLISTWRSRMTRVMLVVLVCAIIGSLGTHLYVAGQSTIPLPWIALEGLPVFEQVIPVRLSMYTALVVAIAVALILAASSGSSLLRWELALVGLVMLLPSDRVMFFHSTPPDPKFFTTDQYKQHISRDETVLAFPYSQLGYSMLWQARTDMWFDVAGGYLAQRPPDEYLEEPVVVQFYTGDTNAETPCLMKSFIERRDVGVVLIESGSEEPWGRELEKLGMRSQTQGGIDLYQVPATLPSPAGCS